MEEIKSLTRQAVRLERQVKRQRSRAKLGTVLEGRVKEHKAKQEQATFREVCWIQP